MPQGRIVLKRICQSKKLADLKTDGARLLYTWLIPNMDINGCFSADPEVIKGQIFTRLRKSTRVIAGYLEDLEDELIAELEGLLSDLNDLEEFGSDTSLDGLDDGLGEIIE